MRNNWTTRRQQDSAKEGMEWDEDKKHDTRGKNYRQRWKDMSTAPTKVEKMKCYGTVEAYSLAYNLSSLWEGLLMFIVAKMLWMFAPWLQNPLLPSSHSTDRKIKHLLPLISHGLLRGVRVKTEKKNAENYRAEMQHKMHLLLIKFNLTYKLCRQYANTNLLNKRYNNTIFYNLL